MQGHSDELSKLLICFPPVSYVDWKTVKQTRYIVQYTRQRVLVSGDLYQQILTFSTKCNISFPKRVLNCCHFVLKSKQRVKHRDNKTCGYKFGLSGWWKDQVIGLSVCKWERCNIYHVCFKFTLVSECKTSQIVMCDWDFPPKFY